MSCITDENDPRHIGLVNLGIMKDLLDGLERTTEEILAKLLETRTGRGCVEVDTLK